MNYMKTVTAKQFIRENTQQLAADKFLCPLSGKKFKGADFVRKHILNKYFSNYQSVKDQAEFLNNYLRDPHRPQLPENPRIISGPVAGRGRPIRPDRCKKQQIQLTKPTPHQTACRRTIFRREETAIPEDSTA